MAQKQSRLTPAMANLALSWQTTEGLTIKEINLRLAEVFPDYEPISNAGLNARIKSLKDETDQKGSTVLARPDEMNDEIILGWLKFTAYRGVYEATAKGDQAEIRKATDSLLKVMRAEKDLLGRKEIQEDDEMTVLLARVQARPELEE